MDAIQTGVDYPTELRALDRVTVAPYSGGATVYAGMKNITNSEWWDDSASSWVASEPVVSDCISTTYNQNGDYGFTIPAEAIGTDYQGTVIRVFLWTTTTEANEVLVSEVRDYLVSATTSTSAGSYAPETYNLAKYREELRASLSMASTDDFWSNSELVHWVNRSAFKIWAWLVAVDPELYVEWDYAFSIDPDDIDNDKYVYAALPAGTYSVVALEIDGLPIGKIRERDRNTRTGWWIKGSNIYTSYIPGDTVDATLGYILTPDNMVNDSDADDLPDDNLLRDWIVPLARVMAIWKEQYETSDEYVAMAALIKTEIRDHHPRADRVVHDSSVYLGTYDGFEG